MNRICLTPIWYLFVEIILWKLVPAGSLITQTLCDTVYEGSSKNFPPCRSNQSMRLMKRNRLVWCKSEDWLWRSCSFSSTLRNDGCDSTSYKLLPHNSVIVSELKRLLYFPIKLKGGMNAVGATVSRVMVKEIWRV